MKRFGCECKLNLTAQVQSTSAAFVCALVV